MTGDLVERLRAALDETEVIARVADGACVHVEICDEGVEWHSGDFDAPAHVLRSVAAHRKILDRHAPRTNILGLHCAYCSGADWQLDWPCDDLLDVASIYFPEGTE